MWQGHYRYMFIGETEAFNVTHERWCLSKELIRISPLIDSEIITNLHQKFLVNFI
jgi:hypothetical protein